MTYESKGKDSLKMSLRDWRQALESPPSYSVGKRTLRLQIKHISLIVIIFVFILTVRYFLLTGSNEDYRNSKYTNVAVQCNNIYSAKQYNSTYPLTRPIRSRKEVTFRIAVVSDLDTESKSKSESNVWVSYLQKGYLTWNPVFDSVRIIWDKNMVQLKSSISHAGRGMELSELVVFNGKLYALDDRTGIVYEIVGNEVVPWVILSDGDGGKSKGFKSEWATVKNENLIIGGLGKEWTNSVGKLINYDPQWIKTVSMGGEVSHKNWKDNYQALLEGAGASHPGYMIHESGAWSEIHKQWFFLPRRFSKSRYDEESDELMGTNLILNCDENFKNIKVSRIGDVNPSHGFSSFKFIPGSGDEVIVAIKSEELRGSVASYAMAFKLDGKILMPETKIDDLKFEGKCKYGECKNDKGRKSLSLKALQ